MSHYAYLLRCADGTFYAGYTTDPERRVAEHDAGEGAKYTRGRTPVELVHLEAFGSRSAAMSREYELKQLSHDEKAALAEREAGVELDGGGDGPGGT
ncbi:GIY-YIG nuclease family protein [Haloglomus litoreum]|uniref:GIY-YIG nuclease family protein n=1 Tax=Haloglomus litoreum TaxID=3034026 RepID=UPI0023E8FA1E|nr:GIY-YIG nuclease family protein [Haloglomus sp. DT116]